MNKPMPQINLSSIHNQLEQTAFIFNNPITGVIETVNGLEATIQIIATQGKNTGRLRASKPPMTNILIERERNDYIGRYYTSPLTDCAGAQVWRYVAFAASPLGQHQSLPIMASFDCPFDMSHDEMRQFSRWCQDVADIILTQIKDQPGIDRWSRALGY